jgi:hypothetical protein
MGKRKRKNSTKRASITFQSQKDENKNMLLNIPKSLSTIPTVKEQTTNIPIPASHHNNFLVSAQNHSQVHPQIMEESKKKDLIMTMTLPTVPVVLRTTPTQSKTHVTPEVSRLEKNLKKKQKKKHEGDLHFPNLSIVGNNNSGQIGKVSNEKTITETVQGSSATIASLNFDTSASEFQAPMANQNNISNAGQSDGMRIQEKQKINRRHKKKKVDAESLSNHNVAEKKSLQIVESSSQVSTELPSFENSTLAPLGNVLNVIKKKNKKAKRKQQRESQNDDPLRETKISPQAACTIGTSSNSPSINDKNIVETSKKTKKYSSEDESGILASSTIGLDPSHQYSAFQSASATNTKSDGLVNRVKVVSLEPSLKSKSTQFEEAPSPKFTKQDPNETLRKYMESQNLNQVVWQYVSRLEKTIWEKEIMLQRKEEEVQKLQTFWERSKKLVTCQVCLEVFTNPQVLECGHTFCYSCIKAWAEQSPEDNGSCPTCRNPLTQKPQLNVGLEQFVYVFCT